MPFTEYPINASVHRFHELTAIYIGTGDTVYLSAAQARELGKALIAHADDIDSAVTYTKSTLPTFNLSNT